jgi:hypothetical protein
LPSKIELKNFLTLLKKSLSQFILIPTWFKAGEIDNSDLVAGVYPVRADMCRVDFVPASGKLDGVCQIEIEPVFAGSKLTLGDFPERIAGLNFDRPDVNR